MNTNKENDLLRYLRANGPTPSKQLIEQFGISRATLSRRVNSLSDAIVTIGKGRSTQFAARHEGLPRAILEAMSTVPRNAGYEESEYYDGYGKFFLFGDSKARIPANYRIYNKVGYAYGTLSDNAYVVDEANNLEFLLTATILVNQNGIFNDDDYQYDEVGIPFLAQLGREVHRELLERASISKPAGDD